jgi:hypothetical protein
MVTDITEHPTREGKLYCAVVLDNFSRRVVGWSIDAAPTAALVTNALGMAIDRRIPATGAIGHSDQGVQFASWAFTRARDSGLVPSMGSVDDCGVLVADAGRAAGPPPLAHPCRAGQRDLRVPGGLPQPATPPQQSWHADPIEFENTFTVA